MQSKSSSSSSAGGSVPVPRTIKEHLSYTLGAARALLDLRRRRQDLDQRLRDAVGRRDAALERVGLAVRAVGGLTGRLIDYVSTLVALESEQAVLAQRLDDAGAALTRAEEERRAALGGLDARIAEVRAEAVPQEQTLDTLREARTDLDRRLRGLDGRRRSAESAVRRLHSRLEAADVGEEREPIAAELAEAEGELALARADLEAAEIERRAQDAPLAACGEQVADFHDRLMALRGERKQRAAELAERIEAAALAVGEGERRVEEGQGRQRATLVDLGREAVSAPPDDPSLATPLMEAHEALAGCESIRTDRAAVLATREDLDLAPVWRTLLVGGGVLAVLWILVALIVE